MPELQDVIETLIRSRKQEVALLEKLLLPRKKLLQAGETVEKCSLTGKPPLESGEGRDAG